MENPVFEKLSLCKLKTSSILHNDAAKFISPLFATSNIFLKRAANFLTTMRTNKSNALLWLITSYCILVSSCTNAAVAPVQTSLIQTPGAAVQANVQLTNINTANAEQLAALPNIGAGLAARIIEHRTRYGRFRRVEHLMLVSGISEQRFRELQSLIVIE